MDVADAFREAVIHSIGRMQTAPWTQTRAAGLGRGLESVGRPEIYPSSPANETLPPVGLMYSEAVVLCEPASTEPSGRA